MKLGGHIDRDVHIPTVSETSLYLLGGLGGAPSKLTRLGTKTRAVRDHVFLISPQRLDIMVSNFYPMFKDGPGICLQKISKIASIFPEL